MQLKRSNIKTAVMALVFVENMKDTMVMQILGKAYQESGLRGKVVLVGGTVEDDENFINAMVREFFEETGLKITKERFVTSGNYVQNMKDDPTFVQLYSLTLTEEERGKMGTGMVTPDEVDGYIDVPFIDKLIRPDLIGRESLNIQQILINAALT